MNKIDLNNKSNLKQVTKINNNYFNYKCKYYFNKCLFDLLDIFSKIAPYALSSLILISTKYYKNLPFKYDSIIEYDNVISYDTSNTHDEVIQHKDNNILTNVIELHSPFVLNDNNLYEKTIYYYNINGSFSNDEILNMNINDIEKYFSLENIKCIQKSVLSAADIENNDSYIMIVSSSKRQRDIRKETFNENFKNSISFIYLSLIIGYIIMRFNDKKLKIFLKDYINENSFWLTRLNEEDINKTLDILEKNNERLMVK